MRTLVTGGAGFIGSTLVDALVARGDSCTVLDDLSRGEIANLAHHGDRVTFVEGSVTDRDLVDSVVPGHDMVFHLASVVGVATTIADPERVVDVIVNGTRHVLAAADADAAVLVASSSEVYGRSPDTPFEESTPGVIGAPTEPRWSYAHAKACSEHLALAAARTGRRPPSVVRYFNVYGPRMAHRDPSVMSRFLSAARRGEDLEVHGDGHQTRCFVHVDDAVAGTLAVIERARGRVVNLGSATETSIAELAEMVLEVSGTESRIRHCAHPDSIGHEEGDPQRRSASGALARELLGWTPQVPLLEGLRRTWAEDFVAQVRPGG